MSVQCPVCGSIACFDPYTRELDGWMTTAAPPPQPALDRLAADADESERRGVEWRERAGRAEEEARALRLEVAALKEAQGELVDVIYDGDYPICPRCHDRLMCCGCWWPYEERP